MKIALCKIKHLETYQICNMQGFSKNLIVPKFFNIFLSSCTIGKKYNYFFGVLSSRSEFFICFFQCITYRVYVVEQKKKL